jgi:hypothetical protein
MKFIFLLSIFLMASGCYSPPDVERMKSDFIVEKKSFDVLYGLIKSDLKGRKCFAVGYEKLGDFWESSGLWSSNDDYSRKITIDEALKEVGLSQARYSEYLGLFKLVGAQRIGYCEKSGWARITMATSGLGVSGCLTSINISRDKAVPKTDIAKGYSSEITTIMDGWYINHDCT